MAKDTEKYFIELLNIRTYLIKIGPQRHQTGTICIKKFEEANNVLDSFEKWFCSIKDKVERLSQSELISINKYSDHIKKLYKEIKLLCNITVENKNMEDFNLKTAVSLLPIMDDRENTTKNLISSIEMYSSLLDEKSRVMLINFVLKTRLSEGARLRLNQKYDSVEHLIKDMRDHLLTKKSFTALQHQLLRCTQNQRDIEDYGKQIEQLFVELTISQADGDTKKYEILKPINEKMAIKQFTTGLRNGNLSTIISARNYENLKDAIRGAKDEQTSMTPVDNIMNITNRQDNNSFYSTRGRFFQGRGRANFNNSKGTRWQSTSGDRGHPNRETSRGTYQYRVRGNRRLQGQYFYSNRGRSNQYQNSRVNYMSGESQEITETQGENENAEPSQFFREQ
ncbi:unnamed protein product [Diatraea saccharalis]|uniref:Uncharacterized protein n=1 Tax=Diatraea saccharalis TaxID=40085 RepID=A0A9N9R1N0_9NEOP|nr:unnamed protein product [Diatraea saccharalis]